MKSWSGLRKLFQKIFIFVHPSVILRELKKKEGTKKTPYSEKDILSVLSTYVTVEEGMDSVIADKRANNKYGRKHVTRQTVDMYRERLTPDLLYPLFNNIKQSFYKYNRYNDRHRRPRTFAIDGSVGNANKDLHYTENFQFTKKEKYSQFKIMTLYDVDHKIPVAQYASANFDERCACEEYLFKYIHAGDTVIFDAGFYSHKLFELLCARGIKCIFKAKKNMKVCKKLTADKMELIVATDKRAIRYDIKYIQTKTNKYDCNLYLPKESQFYILTNIMDEPIEHIKKLYHDRWYIEEYYKIIKHYMKEINIKCKKKELIDQELLLKMILVMLARYFVMISENNNKTHKRTKSGSVNFKILLHQLGTTLLDALIFSNSNKLLTKLVNIALDMVVYNSPGKHNLRMSIIDKGKWYGQYCHNLHDPP